MSPRRTIAGTRTLTVPALEPRLGSRSFAHTWWGNAWVRALEAPGAGNGRLQRGRTYARSGAVGAMTVTPGRIEARVSGSRRTPYRTSVALPVLDDAAWDRLLEAVAAQAGQIAALLDRELPETVADSAGQANAELLPRPREFDYSCSCPDWGHPCKHAAAVCYQFARLLDGNPFALFLVRGRAEAELLEDLQQRNAELGTTETTTAARKPEGLLARDAFARARSRLPALPPLPPAPERPGPFPVLTGTTTPAPSIDPEALELLAVDAAARALRTYTEALHPGGGPTAQYLPEWHDIVRWAATDPGIHVFTRLCHASRRPPRVLAQAVRAWRYGGPEGLAVLEEDFTPEPDDLARARRQLRAAWEGEQPPTLRTARNRWTIVGQNAQLRYGRDGRWYPYGKQDGHWWPTGHPDTDPAAVLTDLLTVD